MTITHDNTLTKKQKDMDKFDLIPQTIVKASGIQELKQLQLEIDDFEVYGNWYTTESWSRDMTLDEVEKSNMLYERSIKNTARIREIILNEL